jgi:uncharacterized NAD(P)/FAD-binding protein YdhS
MSVSEAQQFIGQAVEAVRMKGVLWEVLAVPEIRVQAEQLARLLLNKIPQDHAA